MIHTVVFDLGNVLLHFDHSIILKRISPYMDQKIGLTDAWRMLKSEIALFETGLIGPEEFFEKLRNSLNLAPRLGYAEFAKNWAEIFWKNEELVDLLPKLRKKVKLIMLSNTNVLHIEYAKQAFPEVFSPFDAHVLSYEAGCSKPSPEIYRKVLKLGSGNPNEFVYFDDIYAYIQAAEQCGMKAHQYVSVQGVRDSLAMYSIEFD